MTDGRDGVATLEAEPASDEDIAELLSSGLLPNAAPTEADGYLMESAEEGGWEPAGGDNEES
jgi:hypothetical protein